ncbi:MAG: metalloregulator ArsR/SmtB family transcription factor [Thermoplasmata archaeon]
MTSPSRSAPLFAALGDPHRLRIVGHLSHSGPQSVSRLTEGSGISRQAISKHVGILERAGVVHSSRRGRERLLELESLRLLEARRFLTVVSAQWDGALQRLRRLVEE